MTRRQRWETFRAWQRDDLDRERSDSPTRAGEEGFAPRSFAHHIPRARAPEEAAEPQAAGARRGEGAARQGQRVVVVPDDARSVTEAARVAQRAGGQVFVKPGEVEWREALRVGPGETLHLFAAEPETKIVVAGGALVSGGVECRGRAEAAERSQGSLLLMALQHSGAPRRAQEAVLEVLGAPWVLDRCAVRAGGGTNCLSAAGEAHVTLRRSTLCELTSPPGAAADAHGPARSRGVGLWAGGMARALLRATNATECAVGLAAVGEARVVAEGSQLLRCEVGAALGGDGRLALWSCQLRASRRSALLAVTQPPGAAAGGAALEVRNSSLADGGGAVWLSSARPGEVVLCALSEAALAPAQHAQREQTPAQASLHPPLPDILAPLAPAEPPGAPQSLDGDTESENGSKGKEAGAGGPPGDLAVRERALREEAAGAEESVSDASSVLSSLPPLREQSPARWAQQQRPGRPHRGRGRLSRAAKFPRGFTGSEASGRWGAETGRERWRGDWPRMSAEQHGDRRRDDRWQGEPWRGRVRGRDERRLAGRMDTPSRRGAEEWAPRDERESDAPGRRRWAADEENRKRGAGWGTGGPRKRSAEAEWSEEWSVGAGEARGAGQAEGCGEERESGRKGGAVTYLPPVEEEESLDADSRAERQGRWEGAGRLVQAGTGEAPSAGAAGRSAGGGGSALSLDSDLCLGSGGVAGTAGSALGEWPGAPAVDGELARLRAENAALRARLGGGLAPAPLAAGAETNSAALVPAGGTADTGWGDAEGAAGGADEDGDEEGAAAWREVVERWGARRLSFDGALDALASLEGRGVRVGCPHRAVGSLMLRGSLSRYRGRQMLAELTAAGVPRTAPPPRPPALPPPPTMLALADAEGGARGAAARGQGHMEDLAMVSLREGLSLSRESLRPTPERRSPGSGAGSLAAIGAPRDHAPASAPAPAPLAARRNAYLEEARSVLSAAGGGAGVLAGGSAADGAGGEEEEDALLDAAMDIKAQR